jgi:hypothetical protein
MDGGGTHHEPYEERQREEEQQAEAEKPRLARVSKPAARLFHQTGY